MRTVGLWAESLVVQMGERAGAMRNTVAVMNTKGVIGKSTIVLSLAKALAAFHKKKVLVIDSDPRASVSSMLMTPANLHQLQCEGLTIAGLLGCTVLNNAPALWPRFAVRGLSDVDDARSVYLIPSGMQLALFEREVSKESLRAKLHEAIARLLMQLRPVFDLVLIDCPPGLSALTESWLRGADFHISLSKADRQPAGGSEGFCYSKSGNPEMGFAEDVVINVKDRLSAGDEEYRRWLRGHSENHCFEQTVPRTAPPDRSDHTKYRGDAGQLVRALRAEVLTRLAYANGASLEKPAAETRVPAAPRI
jgi:chromosome partitioning protein